MCHMRDHVFLLWYCTNICVLYKYNTFIIWTHLGYWLFILPRQLVKLSVSPATRLESLLSKVQVLQQKKIGPCGAFAAAYKYMCDYHALAHLDDVQWVGGVTRCE